jgi:hypothetical protein
MNKGVSVKINQEHLIGLVCIAVAGVILSITPSFPKGQAAAGITGPAFFPNLLAFVYILCGIYQIWHGFARKEKYAAIGAGTLKEIAAHGQTRTAYLILGLVAAFIFLLDILGFIIMTLIFLFIFMKRLGVTTLKTVMYSFIFTLSIYFLFGWLFTISLPSGLLGYIGL